MTTPVEPPRGTGVSARGWETRLRVTISRLGRTLRAGLPQSAWDLTFVALVLAFITFMAGLSTARYWSFQTRGWDLGVYLQAFTNIAHGSALPFLPHFTPFAWLIAPLLLAFPGATTLLVVQAAALGGSGFIVYWMLRASTGREDVACVVGTAYLFGIMPISIGWFDFHAEAFLPLFFLAALYARQRSHLRGFVLASLLALSVEEFSIILLLGLGIACLLSAYFARRRSAEERTRDRSLARLAVILSVGWGAGVVLVAYTTASLSRGASALFAGGYGPAGLGAPTLTALPYVLSSELSGWWTNLPDYGGGKLLYVILLFGAFGFLSFAGDLAELLPAGIWLLFALGSTAPALLTFGDQYVAYALPFVAASACSGIARTFQYAEARTRRPPTEGVPVTTNRRRWVRSSVRTVPVAVFLVGMVTVSALCYPLWPQPLQGAPAVTFGFPEPTPHQQALREIIDLIPPDARVLTTNDLFSQLATDPNALLSPISPVTVRGTTVARYIAEEVAASSYVLLDFTMDWTNSALVQLYGNWSDFHVVAAGDGIRLLARGPAVAPVLWFGPETYSFGPSAFSPELAQPGTGPNGSALVYQGTERTPGFFWTGPYFPLLAPGVYVLSAHFDVTLPEPTTAFEVKVLQDGFTVASNITSIGGGYESVSYGFVGDSANQSALVDTFLNGSAGTHSYTLSVPFDWTSIGAFEFVGLNPSIGQSVAFYGLTVQDTEPLP